MGRSRVVVLPIAGGSDEDPPSSETPAPSETPPPAPSETPPPAEPAAGATYDPREDLQWLRSANERAETRLAAIEASLQAAAQQLPQSRRRRGSPPPQPNRTQIRISDPPTPEAPPPPVQRRTKTLRIGRKKT